MASREFPRICVALGLATPEKLLEEARHEIEAGEQFLEFRLDFLRDPRDGIAVIRKIVAESPDCAILATCRRHQNHGRFNGSIEEQVAILEDAVAAGARAVDVELESAENIAAHLERLRTQTALIISYHNFEGTPALQPVMRRMLRIPAYGYKVVTTARKPSDNQRVLALAKAYPKEKLVMLAMGEMGVPTRVLAPAFGGLFTYAAPCHVEGTASGQLSPRLLRPLYRVERLSRNTRIYGVIADPVRHSASPAVHNRAFQAKRIDAVYLPLLVHPGQLKDLLTAAEKVPIHGFSVTIPHKQKIMRYLDTIEPLARRIGAVNTVWRRGGKWRGTNTDVDGVTGPLSRVVRLAKTKVLLVGNGGAARAAAFALAGARAALTITGRNPDRVRALAAACGAEALLQEQAFARHFDVLVHATPVGMYPHVEECLFNGSIPADLVFDMVYNPIETKLVRLARDLGKQVILGLDMFVEQATRQFEIWSGEAAPRAVMEKAAREAILNSELLFRWR